MQRQAVLDAIEQREFIEPPDETLRRHKLEIGRAHV